MEVPKRRFFTYTHRIWVCIWYNYKSCQRSDQGLDEQKTYVALAVHTCTKAGYGIFFLPFKKKLGNCSTWAQTQLRIMRGLLTGHCNIKAHLFKVCLVNGVGCDKCNQASEIASHVLCGCEALVTFRFRPPHYHFMKPGNSEDIVVSTVLHFFQAHSWWMHEPMGRAKDWKWSKCMGHCLPFCFLLTSIQLYSNLLYSILISTVYLWLMGLSS